MNAVETCAICGGSGWKIVEREGISGAEKCECANAGREQRVEDRANIPPLYQNASLDNFVLPANNPVERPKLAKVLLDVRGYVREYPKLEKPGLLFMGPPGTGKTHLAVAALRGLIARGFEGVFYDFQALLNHIRSGYDAASGTMDRDAYRSALEAEILVLDDLGAHRVTDWVEDTVTSIITQRCNNKRRHHRHHQPARSGSRRQARLGIAGRSAQPSFSSKSASACARARACSKCAS